MIGLNRNSRCYTIYIALILELFLEKQQR